MMIDHAILGLLSWKPLTGYDVKRVEKLNITDRAVSKWETGKSMPDSSIMLELCEDITHANTIELTGINDHVKLPDIAIVNVILSKMIEEPVFDVWDMMSIFILLILAFVLFICDYAKKKG